MILSKYSIFSPKNYWLTKSVGVEQSTQPLYSAMLAHPGMGVVISEPHPYPLSTRTILISQPCISLPSMGCRNAVIHNFSAFSSVGRML